MMIKAKFGILNCLIIAYLALVKADCQLKYPEDIEEAPLYTKYFGIYSLELPYTRQNIQLKDGEIINATCRTVFDPIRIIKKLGRYNNDETVENQMSILLNCKENSLYAKEGKLQGKQLKCQKLNWSIYDDNKIHKWCNENTGTTAFLLATKSNFNNHLLAEICFDLKSWSLKSITYNVTAPSDDVEVLRDVMKTQLQSADITGTNLWNFKSTNIFDLTDFDLQKQLKEMGEGNFWLQLANYEISSIVQGKAYQNYFKEYSNHLNTIWWSNLRLGNWKRFMDTLETYAYNNSFQLYTGTSGVVRKPNSDDPHYKTDLTIKFNSKKKPVPAYIWTYLTSIDNTNRDFVIVGYNSPYAKVNKSTNKSEIVFCIDICDEIPWLKNISSSFSYVAAGILFCCSTESAENFKNLDGFPISVLISRQPQKPDTEIKANTTNYNKFADINDDNKSIDDYDG